MRRSRFASRSEGPARRARRLLVAAAALAASALAAPAFANTITFETASTGAGFTGPVTEDGFTYSLKSGGLFVDTYGNPGKDMEGAETAGGGVLKIVAAGGGNFTFNALDFAAYSSLGTGTQTLDVTGLLGGSAVGSDAYTLTNTKVFTPKYANWTTEAASVLAGKPLSELDVTLEAGISPSVAFFEAIDNVVLTPASAAVPEPSSLALLAAGLLGFGVVRRRKA